MNPLIRTWGKDGARLWHIQADFDFPNVHLPLFVEVVTGTVVNDFGNMTILRYEK